MMGEPVGRQDRLFYEFSLDEVVPEGHLLQRIDGVLDLSWLQPTTVTPVVRRSKRSLLSPDGNGPIPPIQA